ncbi:MAG TPA: SIMPL domain-containing protein [Candidatus Acidoferrum sp.]|jgi:uncharacterized protein YggE|nr:SIMPL domain-containing protein [Candidatus Acidoferrum sp.]
MWINQSITRPIGITVYGSHISRTEPDRAEIDIAVIRLAQTPAVAFDATAKSVKAVRAGLKTGGISDADVEVSLVTLTSAHEFSGGTSKFIGYRSQVGFRFLVTRLETVERLLTSAVEAGANEVQRVRYQSSKLRELRAEARKHAVEAAKRKAQVYADAAGVRVGQVIHIEDVNPDAGSAGRGHSSEPAPADESDDETGGGLEAGSLVVSAAVMVTFNILHD